MSEQIVVFTSDSYAVFALLQAIPHTEWLTTYASSMRTDVRYTPSDCFETYPRPSLNAQIDCVGETYYLLRQDVMQTRREGLTKIYNRMHDPSASTGDVQRLRELHVEMDRAVSDAYGWTGLDLGHGFHATKQGVRFTISEAARREVLGRLLRLNHERYEEEVRQGLHEKGKAKGKGKRRAADAPSQGGLDLPEEVAL